MGRSGGGIEGDVTVFVVHLMELVMVFYSGAAGLMPTEPFPSFIYAELYSWSGLSSASL